ncbi:hypothetical protein A0O34_11195 [Chryseobacterium glaciei]|uniref:Uncharacterized protein n=2 Tax=Chryseobacterium glaciei TaxID=1685010 RepID=A0A172XVK3_9FLAO|nr:hypothetical protein A0O34_11195 [Chryseobacterium glaciei]
MFFWSCNSQKQIAESNFYEEDENINLYAFVGKKISIEEILNNKQKIKDPNSNDSIIIVNLDQEFKCNYQILQNVFNKINKHTIEFEAYDHYGTPDFKNYEYILLYLSKDTDGKFTYMKYQFDALKSTNKGFKGRNGKSIKKLFLNKKNTTLKERISFYTENNNTNNIGYAPYNKKPKRTCLA